MTWLARSYRKLREEYSSIVNGVPGRRFIEHYERQRRAEKHATAWKTAAYMLLGVALLLAGLVLSIPPGLPGFLLWLPGLALLVGRLRWFALFLDRAERFLRGLWKKMKLS